MTLDEGQWMTLTYDILKASCTHLVDCFYQLDIIDNNSLWKTSSFYLFPHTKSKRDQIWPCCKIGKGHPMAVIWTNKIVFENQMLHTKFQGHRLFGSREEDFFKVYTLYEHGGHFWTCDQDHLNRCRSPISWWLHIKFRFNRPSGF